MKITIKIIVIFCIVLIVGCRSLQVQKEDSTALATAKVAGRVGLGIVTLGLSEIEFYELREMESWVGSNKAKLIQSWGPPSSTTSDGQGGEILIYTSKYQTSGHVKSTTEYDSSTHTKTTRTTFEPSETIKEQKMFYVNSDGKIYNWKIKD